MPRARDRMATVANSGLRARLRIARRTSDVEEEVMVRLDGITGMVVYREVRQIPSSKSQIPTNPQVPTPNRGVDWTLELGTWNLGFPWDLGFGAWDLT